MLDKTVEIIIQLKGQKKFSLRISLVYKSKRSPEECVGLQGAIQV